MKVTGASSPTSAGAPARAKAAAPGFSVSAGSNATASHPPSSISAAAGVGNVSALMALQGMEDATERRRRSVRRATGLLDRLDEVKLALLSGQDPIGSLDGLARGLREQAPSGDDEGLDAVIGQIDLRAAVELAKAELRRTAA